MKKNLISPIFLSLVCVICLRGVAAENGKFPSLTDVGPYETPSRYSSGTATYNLGPTGARGWARTFNGGKLFWGENGREILITYVYPGSPADGKLEVFDVLVGTDGKTFDKDALKCLGNAIAKAQRSDGKLSLQVWRRSKIFDVTLQLPELKGDSWDAPIVAKHSQALRKQFLDFLKKNMHPDGFRMYPAYAALNALYLLANGKPEDLDYVRRHMRGLVESKDHSKYGPWAWATGPNTTLLSEYFQKTGDTSVLPAIKQNMEWMRNSQSYAGGWGHGGPYGGYGHVGLPGMFNTVGAVLGRECGIKGYDDMISPALKLYSRAAGLGVVGYAGVSTMNNKNLKTVYGDNGKSGTAAVLYGVAGDEKLSRTYANSACVLAPYSESGHCGHFWSFSWGALGANRADLDYRKVFAQELDWYYALARTWRGGLTAQPWLATMAAYAPGGEDIATGGMALWYCTPLKSLRILGGDKSVLCQDLPKPLDAARKLIYDNKYNECIAALERFKPLNKKQREQADALKVIAKRGTQTIELTLNSIRENIDRGDLYLAERQLHSLKPILNDKGKIKELDEFLKSDKSKVIIDAGDRYYHVMAYQGSPDREFFYKAPAIVFNPKKRSTMKEIADSKESGVYAKMAKEALKRWKADDSLKLKYKTLVEKEVTFPDPYVMYLGKGENAKKGVAYKYYEFDTIPENPQSIKEMKPVKEGIVQGFDLKPKKRETNFAFVFRTFVEIEREAEYTFTITSDDGSFLYVNGKELIDNGGLHGMEPKSGTIRLTPGRHEVECIMFQGKGGFGLRVEMRADDRIIPSNLQKISFRIDDSGKIEKLKVRAKASDPVIFYLNGEIICRFHKKRKKNKLEPGGQKFEWEELTLRPEALKLLKGGENVLGVASNLSGLDTGNSQIDIQLLGF